LIIETVLVILVNPEYTLGKYNSGEGNIVHQSENYASKALTFASLTFAGLTFILAQSTRPDVEAYTNTVFLFTVGFGLFIVAHKLDVYAPVRQIYFPIQQRLFNFGILALVVGLLVYFRQVSGQLFLPVVVVAIIIGLLHVFEYKNDLEDYRGGEDEDNQSSLSDF
jgi:magnesium-transporting ATPase (P-type)